MVHVLFRMLSEVQSLVQHLRRHMCARLHFQQNRTIEAAGTTILSTRDGSPVALNEAAAHEPHVVRHVERL